MKSINVKRRTYLVIYLHAKLYDTQCLFFAPPVWKNNIFFGGKVWKLLLVKFLSFH